MSNPPDCAAREHCACWPDQSCCWCDAQPDRLATSADAPVEMAAGARCRWVPTMRLRWRDGVLEQKFSAIGPDRIYSEWREVPHEDRIGVAPATDAAAADGAS